MSGIQSAYTLVCNPLAQIVYNHSLDNNGRPYVFLLHSNFTAVLFHRKRSPADCQASATKISRGDFQLRHLRGRSLIISTIASNRACVSLWKS